MPERLAVFPNRHVLAGAIAFGLLLSVFLVLDKPLFFVAAIAGIIVVVPVLRNPRIGLYLTIATIPLDQAGKLGKILPMVNLSIVKIFALLTLFSWLLHLAMKRLPFVWRREATFFLIYYIIGALTLFDALDVKRGLQELVIQGSTLLFFVMTFNLIKTKRQLMIALACLVTVSCATFAYAGIQRLLPGTTIAERVGWLEEGEATSGVEISNIESGNLGETVKRSTGTTSHSNVLGVDTALTVPLLLAFMALARNLWIRMLCMLGVICCLVGLVVSLSRTGMLAYLVITPMLIYTRLLIVTPARVGVMLVAGMASIPFLPEGVSRIFNPEYYFSSHSVSVSERYKLWDAAIRAFLDNPLTGFGFGDNRGIFDYYYNPWNPGLLTVHNTYLQVLIETGIFGMLVLLYFFYRILKLYFHSRRLFIRQQDRTGAILTTGLLISVLTFFLMGGIAFDFMRIGFKNMWLMIAASIVVYHIAVKQQRQMTFTHD